MSIALMTLAWKSSFAAGKKIVLLALCDNANDQGECFPSVSMLVEKCSMSERSVFNHIADLEKTGAIVRHNRPGRSTVYMLNPCKFCTPEQSLTPATVAPVAAQTHANSAPLPLQPLHPTPANSAPTPATVAPITIKEPSINQIPKTKTAAQAPFVLPDWIPSDSWAAFMEVRKGKKAKNSDFALALILKTLNQIRLSGGDAIEAMNNSIRSGWSDVYPPKTFGKTQQVSSFKQSDAEEGMRRWEEQTGRIHPDRHRNANHAQVIDVTPKFQELSQ